jgi:2-aminoadipate transaminase
VRSELRTRCEAACTAAQTYLPPGSQWGEPRGGLYLWVRLPDVGPTAAELYVTAIQHGVAYAMGTLFHTDGHGSRHIRLNFAAHSPARIAEGFKRIGAAWYAWQQEYAPAVRRTPIL